jgi:PAS domain-containing protein
LSGTDDLFLKGYEAMSSSSPGALVDADRVLDLLPVGVCVYDDAPPGAIVQYNPRAIELWGREPHVSDPNERYGGFMALFRPDGTPFSPEDTPMARVLRGGPAVRNEKLVAERPDGSRLTVSVNIAPLRDQHGRTIGAVAVFQDVTEIDR